MRRRRSLLEAATGVIATAKRHQQTIERGYRSNRFIRAIRPNLIPGHPKDNPRQRLFLGSNYPELLFGGAAGGSKSDALGLAALQFVDVPGASSLIIMSQFVDLNGPSALRSRMAEWLYPFRGEGIRWNDREKRFIFPTKWWSQQIDWKRREMAEVYHVDWTEIAESDALHALGDPPPASVTFGFIGSEGDELKFKSQEFQTICVDELTRQPFERRYTFMFSRMRGANWLSEIPHRMLSATNPGDVGQEWVRERFISKAYITASEDARFELGVWTKDHGTCKECSGHKVLEDEKGEYPCYHCHGTGKFVTRFIPSRAKDNKAINRRQYMSQLSHLPPVERARMEKGDWMASTSGLLFKRDWLRRSQWSGGWKTGHFVVSKNKPRPAGMQGDSFYIEAYAPRPVDRQEGYFFITADTATSEKTSADWTVICAWAYIAKTGDLILCDIDRRKLTTPKILPALDRMSRKWGINVAVVENKSSGVFAVQSLAEDATLAPTLVILPYEPGTRDKVMRSQTAQAMMGTGHVYFMEPNSEGIYVWTEPVQEPPVPGYDDSLAVCTEELMQFQTPGVHDDFVDNLSMAAEHCKNFTGPNEGPTAVGGYYEDIALSSVGGFGGMGSPGGYLGGL